jgi:hypothetical protein
MFSTTIRLEAPSDHPSPMQVAANSFAGYLSMTGSAMAMFSPFHLTLMMYRFGRGAAKIYRIG